MTLTEAKQKTAADLLADAFGAPADAGIALPQSMSVNWMVQPFAGMAAMSAIGFGVASQMLGLWADALSGSVGATKAAPVDSAPKAASAPVAKSAVVTSIADARAAADRLARGEVVAKAAKPSAAKPSMAKLAAVAVYGDTSATKPAAPDLEVASVTKTVGKTAGVRAPRAAKSTRISPASVKASVAAGSEAATKPASIERPAAPDDLKAISGIGPKLEQVLNGFGIWTFAQIAGWTPAEIAWVEDKLGFGGRIGRDDWTGQAATLGAGKAKV